MGRTAEIWRRISTGAILFWIGGFVVAYTAAAQSYTPPPAPTFLNICRWAIDGHNLAALVAAIASGIGMVASLVQLFGPKPADETLVRLLFRDVTQGQADIQGQVWQEGQASEYRHAATLAAIARDKHEQALADLELGSASPELRARYEGVLMIATQRGVALRPIDAASAAVVQSEIASSSDLAWRAITDLIVAGNFRAANHLLAKAAGDHTSTVRKLLSQKMREAGYLALPISPADALGYFDRSLEFDPTDVWSWIELGRIRREYDSATAARRCLEAALYYVDNPRDRAAIYTEFGKIMLETGELLAARREFVAALHISEDLARANPDQLEAQRDLVVSYQFIASVDANMGEIAEARQRLEVAITISHRLVSLQPDNQLWRNDLALGHLRLADMAWAAEDFEGASIHFGEALTAFEWLAAQTPADLDRQEAVLAARLAMAGLKAETAGWTAAEGEIRRVAELFEAFARSHPHRPGAADTLEAIQESIKQLRASAGIPKAD